MRRRTRRRQQPSTQLFAVVEGRCVVNGQTTNLLTLETLFQIASRGGRFILHTDSVAVSPTEAMTSDERRFLAEHYPEVLRLLSTSPFADRVVPPTAPKVAIQWAASAR